MGTFARRLVIAMCAVAGAAAPAGAAIDQPVPESWHDESLNWAFLHLEVDARGQLWMIAADKLTGDFWMTRFLPDGTFLGKFPLPMCQTGCARFALAADNTAYVAEADGTVTRFTETGDVLVTFTLPGTGFASDLEVAPDGTLVVSCIDTPAHVLHKVASDGTPLVRWELPVFPGRYDWPLPVAVAPDGTVLAGSLAQDPVFNGWASTVLVLDSELVFQGFWKTKALKIGEIEVDGGGNACIYDSRWNSVYCYTSGGTYLTFFGLYESAMAVARDGRTHYADWMGYFGTYSSPVKDCVVTLNDLDGGYQVDGVVYREPMAFDWPDGSVHRIQPLARSRPSDGVRVDWLGWDDGTRDVREVTASDVPTTLEVRTERRYRVDVTAVGGGSVSPPSDWYLSGTELTLTAVADEGYGLTGWTAEVGVLEPGCCQAGDPPAFWDRPDTVATIMVRGPVAQEATFQRTGFELTISASDTDPFVNSAPPANGPRKLYLWATCLERGMTALEADAGGSLERSPFAPAAGVLTVYDQDPDRLLLAVGGCPTGVAVNRLLGSWWVLDQGGDLCLGPSADNNRIGATDCVSPNVNFWPMQVTGFSSSSAPCATGGNACATPRDRLLAGSAGEADRPGDEPPASGAIAFAEPRPNPFRGRTRLAFTVVAPQPVTLILYDVRGRRVRSYTPENYAPGTHAIEWDGRDEGGKAVPAGIYFARFDGPQVGAARKIVYLGR